MEMAMIVLKNTPKGFKLMPVAEVKDGKGLMLRNGHPLARRAQELMDFLIVEAKLNGIYNTNIKTLFELLQKKYGAGFFDDCKVLSQTAEAPLRLLIKG